MNVGYFKVLLGPYGLESVVEAYLSEYGLPCVTVYLEGNMDIPCFNRQVTPLAWDRLFKKMFTETDILNWDAKYTGDYSSRDYFRILIRFRNSENEKVIRGDGSWPYDFDKLIEILEPYLQGKYEGKNIRRFSKACSYI